MAQSTEPNKLKVPGESTTNPSFAAPQIQTAPDVSMSQKVAGIAPTPNQSTTPATSAGASQPTEKPAKPLASPKAPPSGAETTNQDVPNTPGTPAPLPQQTSTVPTSTGAPPGIPNTATLPPPTPVLAPPKALEGHNANENNLITAQNDQNQKLYEAALAFNGGPTSALAQNQLKATESNRIATGNRGAAGTIESSLYQGDQSRIAQGEADADLKAYNTYQTAVNEANDAMEKATVAYQQGNEQERREIAEAAERRQTTSPVYPGPPSAIAPTSIQTLGPPGAGGVVPRTYRSNGGTVRVGSPSEARKR